MAKQPRWPVRLAVTSCISPCLSITLDSLQARRPHGELAEPADDGLPVWRSFAENVHKLSGAATVSWVSAATGKHYDHSGYQRTLDKGASGDQWFYGFLATGKRYTLNLDKEKGCDTCSVFVNVRFDAGDGKIGPTSVGLAVDKLAETIRSYQVGKSGFVDLVRPNGTLIIHRDTALADGKHNMQDLPGFSAELTGKCRRPRCWATSPVR